MKLNKNEKNTSGELNEIKMPKQEEKDSGGNDLLQFFIGIVLLGAGLFMLSKRVMVHSSWYVWQIGGFDLSSGTVTIPLIIGIIWYFINKLSYLEICVPWPSHPPTPSTSFQVPFSVTLSELTEFPLFSENVSDKDPSDYQKVDNFHPLSPNTSSGQCVHLSLSADRKTEKQVSLPSYIYP